VDVEGIHHGLIKVHGEGLTKMINKTDNYVTAHALHPEKTQYNGNPVFPGGRAAGEWR
jgi:hypothetical protein